MDWCDAFVAEHQGFIAEHRGSADELSKTALRLRASMQTPDGRRTVIRFTEEWLGTSTGARVAEYKQKYAGTNAILSDEAMKAFLKIKSEDLDKKYRLLFALLQEARELEKKEKRELMSRDLVGKKSPNATCICPVVQTAMQAPGQKQSLELEEERVAKKHKQ